MQALQARWRLRMLPSLPDCPSKHEQEYKKEGVPQSSMMTFGAPSFLLCTLLSTVLLFCDQFIGADMLNSIRHQHGYNVGQSNHACA